MNFLFSGSLLRYVGFHRQIDYETTSLDTALRVLFADYPEIEGMLMNQDGTLRRSLRLAINGEVVRTELSRALVTTDSVAIMTAIAGG
jgi:molybdopterin synthase sulfur carrier subunit